MIDTHAHIYLEHFDDDLDNVISSAKENQITKILLPNIDSMTTKRMLTVTNKYKMCFPMIGLHPCSVKENFREELNLIQSELYKNDYIAIGEIGTDLYWDSTYWTAQQEAFNIQCQWALDANLPVVIHCRKTIDETIELVEPWAKQGLHGVFHCFNGSTEQGKKITDLGFYLGIGGVVTFKNAGMDRVIPHLDKEKIILETDSPYLTPIPHRGKRNEPAYISFIAEKVATYWQSDVKSVDRITTENAHRLFKLA